MATTAELKLQPGDQFERVTNRGKVARWVLGNDYVAVNLDTGRRIDPSIMVNLDYRVFRRAGEVQQAPSEQPAPQSSPVKTRTEKFIQTGAYGPLLVEGVFADGCHLSISRKSLTAAEMRDVADMMLAIADAHEEIYVKL